MILGLTHKISTPGQFDLPVHKVIPTCRAKYQSDKPRRFEYFTFKATKYDKTTQQFQIMNTAKPERFSTFAD